MTRRGCAALVVSQAAALFALTGCGGEASKPVAKGEVLQRGDLLVRFREEGEILSASRDGVMCFCLDRDGAKARKYGRFWLNVLPREGGITAPENQPPADRKLENQLRDMLEEGEPDDEGVRWSLEREGWVAVKQYAANVVVVWHGGRTKADTRWKRLDALLTRVTGAAANRSRAQGTRSSDACAAAQSKHRLRELVAAFNAGEGKRLANGFDARGNSFQPYSLRRPIVGRQAIARFVTERAARGDHWLIRSIRTSKIDRYYGPTRGRIYTLFLDVRGHSTKVISGGAATASILCDTGLVKHWIGPAKSPS